MIPASLSQEIWVENSSWNTIQFKSLYVSYLIQFLCSFICSVLTCALYKNIHVVKIIQILIQSSSVIDKLEKTDSHIQKSSLWFNTIQLQLNSKPLQMTNRKWLTWESEQVLPCCVNRDHPTLFNTSSKWKKQQCSQTHRFEKRGRSWPSGCEVDPECAGDIGQTMCCLDTPYQSSQKKCAKTVSNSIRLLLWKAQDLVTSF
jgi:hypothetical protein